MAAIESKIASEKSAIGPYIKANPNINSPLSKPELEALNTLVELQTNTALGKRWMDYHASLLHSETARQLTDTSVAFKDMIARAKEAEAKQAAAQQKKDYLDAVNFVAVANERALQQYGEQLGRIAKDLQADVSAKNIRSYSDALATAEKVRANPKFKLNVQDRQAVINALNALDKATFADNINRLGKAFGVVGKIVQAEKIYDATVHGFRTDDWRPLILEIEAVALGVGAGALIAVGMAFFFPVYASTTVGIIAAALFLALVSSLINSELADRINNVIFS